MDSQTLDAVLGEKHSFDCSSSVNRSPVFNCGDDRMDDSSDLSLSVGSAQRDN